MIILPKHPAPIGNRTQWPESSTAEMALALALAPPQAKQNRLIITPSTHGTQQLLENLSFFSTRKTLAFPDLETLPYDQFSPYQDIISERLGLLNQFSTLTDTDIIVSIQALMFRLPPVHFVKQHAFSFKCKQHLDFDAFKTALNTAGYQCVTEVTSHGEMATRGAVVDVFPMGSDTPFRLEFFDNEIESIRSFDPETQRSLNTLDALTLLPTHEYPLDEKSADVFRTNWLEKFAGNPMKAPIYEHISKGIPANGAEYYLPLFFEETLSSLFDYLPQETLVVSAGDTLTAGNAFQKEISYRYEQLRYDIHKPLCAPQSVFLLPDEVFSHIKQYNALHIKPKLFTEAQTTIPKTIDKPTLITAESAGRLSVLADTLTSKNQAFTPIKDWSTFAKQDFNSLEPTLFITEGRLTQCIFLPTANILIEEAWLNRKLVQRSLKKVSSQDPTLAIKSLAELEIGNPLVHIAHGVGRYAGLETLTTDGMKTDFLVINYAQGDKIYVPIQDLSLISRYAATLHEEAPLHRLGNRAWEKAKNAAQKRIHDVAVELLATYRAREKARGFAFPAPNSAFTDFRNAFPFEETADQTQAIESVLSDMTRIKPMDRLICGDVGFGKTEIAMQASCLATEGGKQVALLAPTTLLANQHYASFTERFAHTAVNISLLSRFQTPSESKLITADLAAGKIDIIIGTHKLLNKAIQFKDIGLLVIDEEQRFGVRHKEQIKALRANVDILTLTATPIPRTLNLSLSGMRDLSLIATPPRKRLPIKTFVSKKRDQLIREAILREILRGGQVYFVHNNVDTMPLMLAQLKDLVPEANIKMGHGQMREKDLEQTMIDFYHQKFNVLLASTIIESGIDIPSANTIIINNANKFGLSQLHQLRGRVGRSHHQAYAYLLVPDEKSITPDAKKRLDAIQALDALGVGFLLANQDLEIRGAGEILGDKQSGNMNTIGHSLYFEMLNETLESMKSGKQKADKDNKQKMPEVDLGITTILPQSYIHDTSLRLNLYKCLADCKTLADINQLQSEWVDRFGKLPPEANNLLSTTRLKHQAKKMGISLIKASHTYLSFHFDKNPSININTLMTLVQTQSNRYSIIGNDAFQIRLDKEERGGALNSLAEKTLQLLS